jgi:hypothetical protein
MVAVTGLPHTSARMAPTAAARLAQRLTRCECGPSRVVASRTLRPVANCSTMRRAQHVTGSGARLGERAQMGVFCRCERRT